MCISVKLASTGYQDHSESFRSLLDLQMNGQGIFAFHPRFIAYRKGVNHVTILAYRRGSPLQSFTSLLASRTLLSYGVSSLLLSSVMTLFHVQVLIYIYIYKFIVIDPALPLFQLGGRRGVDVLRYTICDSPHLQCLLTQRLAGRPPFEKEKQIVGRKPPSISEVGAASPLQFLFVLPRFASPRCPDGTARRSRFEVWQDLIVSLVLFTGVS